MHGPATRTTAARPAPRRARRSFRRTRRGNVIILAVAVLAVLAISAASYVTITRLDRSSAASYSRRTGFLPERNAVLSHIRAILAADLSGNKVVDPSTPRVDASGLIPVWPRMLEDGEYWDAPVVARDSNPQRFTFDQRTTADRQARIPVNTEATLKFDAGLGVDGMFEAAWPDDAWLAASEPVKLSTGFTNLDWNAWTQITNLRSEYRWNNEKGWWERADGRFVDLANFFLSEEASRLRRGDPGADLTILTEEAIPGFATLNEELAGPRAMFDQHVYHLQMSHLEEARQEGDYSKFDPDSISDQKEDAPFTNIDMRMWVDTDGDGRPDARWQEVDALGLSKGLRWVVASRIIDASALINLNTSLEAGDPSAAGSTGNTGNTYAAGVTPADIDLRRLIETASRDVGSPPFVRHPDVLSMLDQEFREHFNEHLLSGLRLGAIAGGPTKDEESRVLFEINDRIAKSERPFLTWKDEFDGRLVDDWAVDGGRFAPPSAASREFTTRAQREAYWRFVASFPGASTIASRVGYHWQENERELRAFLGFNDPAAVTPIEQRFDGPQGSTANRLPGASGVPPYPEPTSLGPMRSGEIIDAPRTFGRDADLPERSFNGNYNQQDKVKRIRNDVRRLLTTYNGSGFISPLPGWNAAAQGDRLNPASVPEAGLLTTNIDAYEREMRRWLSDALGSFMWALAPLAGDRPLMRAGAIGSGLSLAEVEDSRAHYGGWDGGPAAAIETPGTPITAPPNGDSGAFVALRTAAALAVNLADAVDDEDDEPTPTIMRVLKNYEVEQSINGGPVVGELLPGAPASMRADGVIEVGVDFRHGRLPIGVDKLNIDALREDPTISDRFFPKDNDFVVVGLDRQPFIREVASMVMYGFILDILDPPPALLLAQTVPKSSRAAWLLAIELGNPWPTDIALSDYRLTISDGNNFFEIELDNVTVPAGDVEIVYVQTSNPEYQEVWDDAIDQWRFDVPGATELPFAVTTNSLLDLSATTPTVLLSRTVGSVEVLIDRFTPPNRTDEFPFGQGIDLPVDPHTTPTGIQVDPADIAAGRTVLLGFLDGASMSRPTDSSEPGFPAYVIERPAFNQVDFLLDPDQTAFAVWSDDASGKGVDAIFTSPSPHNATLGQPKGPFPDNPVPSFQLFVPDGPLLSPTELLQLSVYAHTFRGAAGMTFDVDDGRDAGVAGIASPWATVSEQLGADVALAYDGTMAPGSSNHNPFFGALDFSRGVLGAREDEGGLTRWTSASGANESDVPHELRLPLALRVMDAFETLGSLGPIAQGRININTASDRVLRMLPLMDPREPPLYTMQPNLGNWTSNFDAPDFRINAVLDYRDRHRSSDLLLSPVDGSNLNRIPEDITRPGMIGLRELAPTDDEAEAIVSLGELALMHEWQSTNGLPGNSPNKVAGFAETGLAVGGIRNPTGAEESAVDIRRSADLYDGVNDLEERLAIVRAVSAVTNTRSDVFIAWFVLRGYDPATIEAIPVSDSVTDEELPKLFEQLTPAHESRWLAVLDRSKVRKPTDRPDIILLVELPPTSP